MKTIITTAMRKAMIDHLAFVISLAARFPEHRDDVSKAHDELDWLVAELAEQKRHLRDEN